jgi:hypothetical protein
MKRAENFRTERLRNWSTASYSAQDGRAAKSTEGPEKKSFDADGESWSVNAQMPKGQPGKGSPSWSEIDQQRCTDYTKIKDRPLG